MYRYDGGDFLSDLLGFIAMVVVSAVLGLLLGFLIGGR